MSLYSLVEMGKESVGEINGLPGSGKSALVVYYFLGTAMAHKTGPIITNIELDIDECVKYVRAKYPEKFRTDESVRERLIQIPPEWWERMAEGATGIAEYLEWMQIEKCKDQGIEVVYREKEFVDPKTKSVFVREVIDEHALDAQGFTSPLQKAMIFLDEAHKPYPSGLGDTKGQTDKMLDFVSTIRHRGAKLYFITQDHLNMARKIRALVQWRVNISSAAMWHIPVIGLPYGWCLQVLAKYFTGVYRNTFTVSCFTGNPDAGETLELKERHAVPTEIFNCYKSHNNEGGVEGEEEKLEWERYGHREFWSWSWQLYKTGITKAVGAVVGFLVFIFPGMLIFSAVGWLMNAVFAFVPTLFGQVTDLGSAPKIETVAQVVETSGDVSSQVVAVDGPPQLRIVGVNDCVFSDGTWVKIGERGPIDGDGLLQSVDVLAGVAVFSSGSVHRLSTWLQGDKKRFEDDARIPGRVQTSNGIGGNSAPSKRGEAN